MQRLSIINHLSGAPGLRLAGLGPYLLPTKGILKLKAFLDQNTFWAQNRSIKNIKKLLAESSVIVTIWEGRRLVAFGRATGDTIYRAALWDIVVAKDKQRLGVGKLLINEILKSKKLKEVEKIYLMTTDQGDFYRQVGFHPVTSQELLVFNASNK
tara:strand:- start:3449 stop:3913 length:465 start_codon:yes stop_codon:yes gene_type:complete